MEEKLKVGDIYEDCGHHPVVCTEVDYEEDSISGKSMIDGSEPRSCSLKHCGVCKLTKEQAEERIEAFKKDGERGLLRLVGWNEEEIEDFMKKWR